MAMPAIKIRGTIPSSIGVLRVVWLVSAILSNMDWEYLKTNDHIDHDWLSGRLTPADGFVSVDIPRNGMPSVISPKLAPK